MKLEKSTYKPFGLEAIETASRDEIAAVQTKRLKRTLENVYENVPLYRRKFDAAGVSPSDFKHLDRTDPILSARRPRRISRPRTRPKLHLPQDSVLRSGALDQFNAG